jgi:DNA mismatch repair protein MutS
LKLTINGLFHPSISNAIKNNVHIDHKQNIIFLTGSNMSGKSSLLKSLGLVIYLAHLGFPVPADAMESTVFNGLITTINLPDNINQGLSHYFTEVKRVKEVAESLLKNNRVFVIFDELFRGTNVKDAFDGSSLIMSELSTINNSAFIISSHIIELAAVLREFSNISFRYLDTYFQDQKPVFTFRLTEGIAKEALGMYIVRNEGIVELLRQAAKNTTH